MQETKDDTDNDEPREQKHDALNDNEQADIDELEQRTNEEIRRADETLRQLQEVLSQADDE